MELPLFYGLIIKLHFAKLLLYMKKLVVHTAPTRVLRLIMKLRYRSLTTQMTSLLALQLYLKYLGNVLSK